MKFARIMLAPILIVILVVSSSLGLLLAATARTATDKNDIKLVLTRSAVYQDLSKVIQQGALEDFINDQDKPEHGANQVKSADLEAFQHVFARYFTPEVYNRSINTIIDSTYDWLDGKSTKPDFTIPIANDKKQFQRFIIKVFTDRFKALPTCKTVIITDRSFNPLEAACRPAGYPIAGIRRFITDEINQPEFNHVYRTAALSSQDIFGKIDPQFNQNKDSIWPAVKYLPWVVFFVLVTCSLLLGLLMWSIRNSFKAVGLTLLPPAALMLTLSTAGLAWGDSFVASSFRHSGGTNDDVNALIKSIASGALRLIDIRILIYSLVLVIIAVSLLVLSFFLNKSRTATQASSS